MRFELCFNTRMWTHTSWSAAMSVSNKPTVSVTHDPGPSLSHPLLTLTLTLAWLTPSSSCPPAHLPTCPLLRTCAPHGPVHPQLSTPPELSTGQPQSWKRCALGSCCCFFFLFVFSFFKHNNQFFIFLCFLFRGCPSYTLVVFGESNSPKWPKQPCHPSKPCSALGRIECFSKVETR